VFQDFILCSKVHLRIGLPFIHFICSYLTRCPICLNKLCRYLVIVDDVWDTATWDIIRCAFPENNLKNRSIVTTRIENVARACCRQQECFYRLKPLNSQDSIRLLFGRALGLSMLGLANLRGLWACVRTLVFGQVSFLCPISLFFS
jgi:hypothetical protein